MFCLSSSERVEGAGGKTAKAKWIPKPSWAKKREPKYLIMDVITNIVIICHGNAELASATSVVDLAKVVFLFLPCLTPTYSLSLSLSLSPPPPFISLLFIVQIKPRKPRKRIKKFILNLAADKSQAFGKKVDEFISQTKGQCDDPHQKMLAQVCALPCAELCLSDSATSCMACDD